MRVYRRAAKAALRDTPSGIGVGDAISFRINAPITDFAAPVAHSIRKSDNALAMALLAQSGGLKDKQGGSCKGKGRASRPSPEASLRMVGVVKEKSASTGRHMLFCQDISDVCGKDAQIPMEEVPTGGLRVGDRVTFDTEEPGEGTPLAFNVRVVAHAGGLNGHEHKAETQEEQIYEDGAEIEAEEDQEMLAVGGEEPEEVLTPLDSELSGLGEWPEADSQEERDDVPQKPKKSVVKSVLPSATSKADPETPEGWIAMQDTLFGNLPKLKAGWIRIRSKSKGLLYYYHVKTGESTSTEPRAITLKT